MVKFAALFIVLATGFLLLGDYWYFAMSTVAMMLCLLLASDG